MLADRRAGRPGSPTHAVGARVTAPRFGEDCLPRLLESGIDGIEHATGLTEQTLRLVLQHRVALVPTLVNIATFPGIAARAEERFPVYAAHMRALHARRYTTVRTAWEAGAGIYTGSDSGGSLPHGIIAHEVVELVRAGVAPDRGAVRRDLEARAWLGHPGLEEGCPADLVVYPADPREDVGVLLAPEVVVLRGRVHPGRPATALA